jgi:3-isopropylmalate dehydrogenase
MKRHIALVPGDGIGVDIIAEAVKILDRIQKKFGHEFTYSTYLAGGCAIDATGKPLPEETLKGCKESDSIILGAVGGPKWDRLASDIRPEKALLGLRGELGLFCNLRPAIIYKQLSAACPLKSEIVGDGLDIMVVRELTGGIYFGERGRDENSAYDTMSYTASEIERIVRKGFEIAQRTCSVTSSAMRLPRSPVPSGCFLPHHCVRIALACMSLSTAVPLTLPARTSPTP